MCFRLEVVPHRKGTASRHSDYIIRRNFQGNGDLKAHGSRNLPAFAGGDPSVFWKAADEKERSNGCAQREYVISLPRVLTDAENVELSETLIQTLAGAMPCEYAYHRGPGKISGEDNPHLHLAVHEREPDGHERDASLYFSRANSRHPLLGGAAKRSGGKSPGALKIDLF